MKFTIPFAYAARFRHYKHRYVETVQLESSVMVEILEAAAPDKPAFEIGHERDSRSRNREWQRFRLIDGNPARVWRLGETLYAEFCAIGDFEQRVRLPDDNPFNVYGIGSATPFERDVIVSSYEQLAAMKRVMEWEDDGGAKKADCIALRAAEMRVVGGKVCIPVSEPVVIVEVEPHRLAVGLSELANDHCSDFRVWSDHTQSPRRYRLENLGQALAYAGRTAREKRIDSHSNIIIRDTEPYAPKFCQEGEHLYQTIKTLFWNIRYCRFVLAQDDVACIRLEEVLAETPDNHSTAALANSAQAVLDKLLTVGKHDLPFGEFLELYQLRRQLEADLGAWRERAYSEYDFAERALPLPATKRVFSQILSLTALHTAAKLLRVSSRILEQEHVQGHRLVMYHAKNPMVVVMTNAMEVKCVYGMYGRIVTADDEALSVFLFRNKAGQEFVDEDDAQSLADIDFS